MSQSKYLTIFNKENSIIQEIPDEHKAIQFPYELDSFQKEGIYRIYNNENILITAHTGSGKTVLALYAIAECFRLGKKVIYTSPTKSLSNQKYAEFVEKMGKDKIGILTGDIKMNPDAPCLIMTTEILRNTLYREVIQKRKGDFYGNENENENEKQNVDSSQLLSLKVEEIGAVVFDEVHYINDPDRGHVWEEVFILLPREVNLVLLSATIDKPEEFAGWLGDMKKKMIHLIPTSHRVVPLRHYFWDFENGNMIPVLMEDGQFKNYENIRKGYKRLDINKIMNPFLEKLKKEDMCPALFFTFSRKKCEKLCNAVQGISFLDHVQQGEVHNIFKHHLHSFEHLYENIPQYQEIFSLVKKGIAYHHSGLIPILKEIVEILFGKGYIKVLFATETFAVGVNMPTKTVVYSEVEKFDNKGRRYLRTDEYLQMSGRAGRRGLDKTGTVILLPTMELPERNVIQGMMTGKSPKIISKFYPSYQFVLKTFMNNNNEEINTGDKNVMDIFLHKTLRYNEDSKKRVGLEKEYEIEKAEYEKNKDLVEKMDQKIIESYIKYDKNEKKLNDSFIILKGKDRKKVEDEQKSFEKILDFKKNKIVYDNYMKNKKKIEEFEYDLWYYDKVLKDITDKMTKLLEENEYLVEKQSEEKNELIITEKGITASMIGEVDEILLTEMIFGNYLDDLSFEEIMCCLSMFLNEGDKSNEEKNINDLHIPLKVKNIYKNMIRISEDLANKESKYEITIHTDMYYEECLFIDLLEPVYLWSGGCDIRTLYQSTSIYEGNFCRGMLRLTQICETVIKICNGIRKYEVVQKLEGYKEKLIRDFTSISSLYVK